MDDKDEVVIPFNLIGVYEDYLHAKGTRARWEAREQYLKEKLVDFLYDKDDPKPRPLRAVTPNGTVMFDVAVTTRRGLDTAYFKRTHPDVYAECEKTTFVKSIKEPPDVSEPGR